MIAERNMNVAGSFFHFCDNKDKSNLLYVTGREKEKRIKNQTRCQRFRFEYHQICNRN
jgi:hypothetical protein